MNENWKCANYLESTGWAYRDANLCWIWDSIARICCECNNNPNFNLHCTDAINCVAENLFRSMNRASFLATIKICYIINFWCFHVQLRFNKLLWAHPQTAFHGAKCAFDSFLRDEIFCLLIARGILIWFPQRVLRLFVPIESPRDIFLLFQWKFMLRNLWEPSNVGATFVAIKISKRGRQIKDLWALFTVLMRSELKWNA